MEMSRAEKQSTAYACQFSAWLPADKSACLLLPGISPVAIPNGRGTLAADEVFRLCCGMVLNTLCLFLAALVAIIWIALTFAQGGFWRIDRELVPPAPPEWPRVTAIIPARNEAEGIGDTLRSLWAQDYPVGLRIVVVDDHSDDGTAEIARQTAQALGREGDLRIVAAHALPPGWTGKVWAMRQGVTRGLEDGDSAQYVLFSDADIAHGIGAVRELVSRAHAGNCDLVSFMVRLQCQSRAEKLMIPAFVYFFKMLYPFRRVNDTRNPLAGAAGGTMLLRRTALERIGGLAAIQNALIDDCALARAVKSGGHNIWLGLSDTSISTRGYGSLSEIVHVIARTAYTQLNYSPLRLLGCVFGLFLTFLLPPLLLLAGGWAAVGGGVTWLLMSATYLPMLRFYRRSPLWAFALPLTACLYLGATLLSAWRHHRGQGGQWKGRSQSSS